MLHDCLVSTGMPTPGDISSGIRYSWICSCSVSGANLSIHPVKSACSQNYGDSYGVMFLLPFCFPSLLANSCPD